MIVGNQAPPLAIKEENHTAIRMDRNHALPGRIQRPGTVLQHPPLGAAAAASGEASLTSDLGRNSTSETVQRATEGARAGSLAAGARRSRPPAAPAQQRSVTS